MKSKHLKVPDAVIINKLAEEETDERYRYLLQHGIVHALDSNDQSSYVELPQIEGILIVYRRPGERLKQPEVIDLSSRDLAHIPLLEGEEKLTTLRLCDNRISRIENIVSLPHLLNLNLKGNQLRELSGFAMQTNQLVSLDLSYNFISLIKNITALTSLQELNLSHNKLEGPFEMSVIFCRLTQLRKIDLSHNSLCLVAVSQIGFQLPNLNSLNLSNNRISDITIGSGSV